MVGIGGRDGFLVMLIGKTMYNTWHGLHLGSTSGRKCTKQVGDIDQSLAFPCFANRRHGKTLTLPIPHARPAVIPSCDPLVGLASNFDAPEHLRNAAHDSHRPLFAAMRGTRA